MGLNAELTRQVLLDRVFLIVQEGGDIDQTRLRNEVAEGEAADRHVAIETVHPVSRLTRTLSDVEDKPLIVFAQTVESLPPVIPLELSHREVIGDVCPTSHLFAPR